MTSTLALFASVTGTLVVWWYMLIRGVPRVIRAAFERKAARIQRQLDEAVVNGQLPADDLSVVGLSRTLEAVVDHADRLSPAFSRLINRTMNVHGRPLQIRGRPRQTFANLSAEQRKLMHGLDRSLADALISYVKYGSVSAWWYGIAAVLRRLVVSASPFARPRRASGNARPDGVRIDRRARPGEALVSTRLAMGALLDVEIEPGLEKPLAQC
jgi:hypothetical protein